VPPQVCVLSVGSHRMAGPGARWPEPHALSLAPALPFPCTLSPPLPCPWPSPAPQPLAAPTAAVAVGACGASAVQCPCLHGTRCAALDCRFAPLSLGRIVDDKLMCSYHGWSFSTGGACAGIPQLPPDQASVVCRCGSRHFGRPQRCEVHGELCTRECSSEKYFRRVDKMCGGGRAGYLGAGQPAAACSLLCQNRTHH